jgi:prevent-host-death family protein
MKRVNVAVAKAQLSQLIDEALRGGEVVIARRNVPVVRLVAVKEAKAKPRFGEFRGCIEMSDDFNAPLDDFDEYTK